jgi:lactate permease
MIWTQHYNPTGSELLSTLLAAAPVIVLLGTLGLGGWPAPRAALAGLLTALAVIIGVYGMPWRAAAAATAFGAAFGLFPIGWIVLMAVFLFVMTVEAGQFEKIKDSVTALSPDRRVQALLIAFSFGAFLEGAAGFGTPVAISSALMIGAGFPPLYAAGLALIANTAPVAFGALGTPIITLAKVTGLSETQLSAMAGRQLPFFSLLVPAWMVWQLSGWRGLRGVWPAVVVSGGTFAALQFSISNFVGPELVDIAGGLGSLVALALMLRWWQPREPWAFDHETTPSAHVEPRSATAPNIDADGSADLGATSAAHISSVHKWTRRDIASAWTPWVILSACVFLWGVPAWKDFLNGGPPLVAAAPPTPTSPASQAPVDPPNFLAGYTDLKWPFPYLHNLVRPDATIVGGEGPDGQANPKPAEFRFNWLSATGTGILVAAIFSAFWLGIGPRQFVRLFLHTLHRLRWSLFTISAMMAIAYLTQYSGSDVTLGLAFTRTGLLYPFFAAMLGWLGVALTGSDTSSNALFGNLQKITAERLGLSPILICAANSTGGVMGKMIDAQSIVVASAATGRPGKEGQILRFVFWPSVTLAALMGLLTLVQAYLLPGMIPAK